VRLMSPRLPYLLPGDQVLHLVGVAEPLMCAEVVGVSSVRVRMGSTTRCWMRACPAAKPF